MLKEICTLIFLGGSAWKDWRSREIPLSLAAVYALGGILCGVLENRTVYDRVLPLGIGAVFLAIAFLSGGVFGIGDGWILVALGCFLDADMYVRTLMIGMLSATVFSGVLLAVFKKNGKTEIPFAPFLLLGYAGGLLL